MVREVSDQRDSWRDGGAEDEEIELAWVGTRYPGIVVGTMIAGDRAEGRETCWQRSLREALEGSKSCDTGVELAGE